MSSSTPSWLRGLVSARGRAALGLGVVLAVGATHTFAYWTDAVPVAGSTFTSGTIDLKVNGSDSVTGYTTLSLPAMVPGNSTAGILTITNSGTAPLKWTAATTVVDADSKNLSGVLTVKVTGGPVTGTSPTAACGGTALAGGASSLTTPLMTTGRLLAPAAAEQICVQVTLPASVGSAYQGARTTADFSFTGTSDLS